MNREQIEQLFSYAELASQIASYETHSENLSIGTTLHASVESLEQDAEENE